jgi:fumarate hydratase, class II
VGAASGQDGPRALPLPVHLHDDGNCAQSADDTFPAVTHIAAVRLLVADLLPALAGLRDAAARGSQGWPRVVTIGRAQVGQA